MICILLQIILSHIILFICFIKDHSIKYLFQGSFLISLLKQETEINMYKIDKETWVSDTRRHHS